MRNAFELLFRQYTKVGVIQLRWENDFPDRERSGTVGKAMTTIQYGVDTVRMYPSSINRIREIDSGNTLIVTYIQFSQVDMCHAVNFAPIRRRACSLGEIDPDLPISHGLSHA